jgi:hypothetical protein
MVMANRVIIVLILITLSGCYHSLLHGDNKTNNIAQDFVTYCMKRPLRETFIVTKKIRDGSRVHLGGEGYYGKRLYNYRLGNKNGNYSCRLSLEEWHWIYGIRVVEDLKGLLDYEFLTTTPIESWTTHRSRRCLDLGGCPIETVFYFDDQGTKVTVKYYENPHSIFITLSIPPSKYSPEVYVQRNRKQKGYEQRFTPYKAAILAENDRIWKENDKMADRVAKKWEQERSNNRNMLGKALAIGAGAAAIGSTAASSAAKTKAITAITKDVITDGKAGATQQLSQELNNNLPQKKAGTQEGSNVIEANRRKFRACVKKYSGPSGGQLGAKCKAAHTYKCAENIRAYNASCSSVNGLIEQAGGSCSAC